MSRFVLAGLLLAAALTGCADDGGVPPIAPDDLAAEISSRMEEEVGVAPEVDCPAELPAEVGATATCTIAASEEVTTALVVEATVTEIDEAERVAAGRGDTTVVLDAQLTARGFYERAGYVAHGDTFMDAGIEHVAMSKAL